MFPQYDADPVEYQRIDMVDDLRHHLPAEYGGTVTQEGCECCREKKQKEEGVHHPDYRIPQDIADDDHRTRSSVTSD